MMELISTKVLIREGTAGTSIVDTSHNFTKKLFFVNKLVTTEVHISDERLQVRLLTAIKALQIHT